ncbi:MAG: nicotinate phosphoribosyltransferase [Chloroflexi bacterium]|nr:nicotinate phosphoribosyltransferase [Chloroflexota bacterium]
MTSRETEISRALVLGHTADIELHRAREILRNESINPEVVMEFTPEKPGVLAGINDVKTLLNRNLPETGREVWALDEASGFDGGEVVLRVRAPYAAFGLYETAINGMLSSCTGWATAARDCVDASNSVPIISLGAHHVHPSVVGVMDYSAVTGGASSCSSVLGARLSGITASGTMAAVLVLVMGDTRSAVEAFDRNMPPEVQRVAIIGTIGDEAIEAIEVSRMLRDKLRGVRLETAPSRGRVTPELVHELRARLDQGGYNHVDIFVSGDLDPEQIRSFTESKAPVAAFGVGYYIGAARPIKFHAEIKELDGRPVARRGLIPGISPNPRLTRVL